MEAQALMREKLRDWQSALEAPEKTFVSLVDVVPPSAPEPDRGRATKLGLLAFVFGFVLSLGIAYLRHQTRARRRARAVAQPAAAGPPPSADRPGPTPRLASVVPGPRCDEGDAEPALVPTSPKKTEPARPDAPEDRPPPATQKNGPAPVPTSQRRPSRTGPGPDVRASRSEPVAVPTSQKKKSRTDRVPTSRRRPATGPVPTSQTKNGRQARRPSEPTDRSRRPTKNGTVPVPTSGRRPSWPSSGGR